MKMKEKTLATGVIVANITPMNRHGGIDTVSLRKLVRHCIAGKVNGIFVLGTTGEGPCLTARQKEEVVRTAKDVTGDKVPLYAGVMDTSTVRVRHNIAAAVDNGADVVVVTPHYYLSCNSQDEIVRHISACAKFSPVPVMAYNMPFCTYSTIELPTVKRIMEIDNVIGLKDTGANWEMFQKELFLKEGTGFKMLSGAEELFGVAMLSGADGCVTGVGNYDPGLLVQLCSHAAKGNTRKTKELQHKLTRLRAASRIGTFWLSGLKYICHLAGLCEEYISLPYDGLTASQKARIRSALKREGLL